MEVAGEEGRAGEDDGGVDCVGGGGGGLGDGRDVLLLLLGCVIGLDSGGCGCVGA